ncbi:E3 ubiquitin-protein ligase highwire-like isoform X4 [Eurosta solidaginis]|uniref:E3 ubiquitin-protein ligase highwire-like isoform X4 n=1 Tax=Eurosta solidaginis TaxID=178769 RepID=UPI00353135B4
MQCTYTARWQEMAVEIDASLRLEGNTSTGASSLAYAIPVGNMTASTITVPWHGLCVRLVGPSFGKKVTWIGVSGTQKFIKIGESLLTTHMLPKVNVLANKKTILLIPTIPLTFHTLSINRRDGSCTAHYRNQINFVQIIKNINSKVMPELHKSKYCC